ncbi:hypothetical protein GYMLUDRAFT_89250 [Collybiopsis luxurians FD-317 M1]|uniref:Uncharacterized protein n=1 Tax=Collybiopsis luxurians FD-317 M1 TaxID=944289 RepID=A0A0D0BMA5_9AGAR|nr:hypothetical protein GYMLUDRAFT_89250 [Collybiopsis luxurians FD-317 M1]
MSDQANTSHRPYPRPYQKPRSNVPSGDKRLFENASNFSIHGGEFNAVGGDVHRSYNDQRNSMHYHDQAQDNHKEFARGGILDGQYANFGDTTYGGSTTYHPGSRMPVDQRGALNVRNNGWSNMHDHYGSGDETFLSQSGEGIDSEKNNYPPPSYAGSNARRNSPTDNYERTPVPEPQQPLSAKEDQLKNRFVRCIKTDPHQTDIQQKSHKRLRDKFLVYMGLGEEEREEEICDDLKKALQVYLHDHEKTGNSQIREQGFKALRAYLHRETPKNLEGALNVFRQWESGTGEVGDMSANQKQG